MMLLSLFLSLSLSDVIYFTDAWISRIKADVGDNWRLKVLTALLHTHVPFLQGLSFFSCRRLFFFQISNLKKILKGILDYNHEVRRIFLCDTFMLLYVHYFFS